MDLAHQNALSGFSGFLDSVSPCDSLEASRGAITAIGDQTSPALPFGGSTSRAAYAVHCHRASPSRLRFVEQSASPVHTLLRRWSCRQMLDHCGDDFLPCEAIASSLTSADARSLLAGCVPCCASA